MVKMIFYLVLSIFIGFWLLVCNLIFYPIAVIWEFKLMSWGKYMAYNYSWGAEYPEDRIIEILEKEKFIQTIKRWVNFNYSIFL